MKQKDLLNWLTLGEGFTTEFKRAGTSNLGREICAFANATGGVILIGVTDTGEIVGVDDHNRLKSEIQATARSAEPRIDTSEHWFTVTFPRPEPGITSLTAYVPESQPESLDNQVLVLVEHEPLSKSEISKRLGQKSVSGQLNKVIRTLLNEGALEYALPDKPNSRLQQYCITPNGRQPLVEARE